MLHRLKAWLAEPGTRKSSFRLTAFFLALSFIVSTAFLSVRNIYDDEYSNLPYVSLSLRQIIHKANTTDVHPPGMYLLTWCAYHLIPSARWMNFLPLCFLYVGLAIFCFTLAPLFRNRATQICYLLLATLHPQLIMWGNTIRWYSWWTGIALATVIFALQPSQPRQDSFSSRRAFFLALLLAALFYLNYITLIFFVALAGTMLFRYSWQVWKSLLLTTVLFAALICPQLHSFLSAHVPNGSRQTSGVLVSVARLVQATLCSEAFLPWHPLAVVILVLFGVLIAMRLTGLRREMRASGSSMSEVRMLTSITLFALIFFCLVAVSGLGFKPRNGLLLAPLLAAPIALAVSSLHWRLQATALALFALWVGVGAGHLLFRVHLAKSNMINRPEEITSYIRRTQEGGCNVVATYDSLLAFTVASADLPQTSLLTPERSSLPAHLHSPSLSQCKGVNLYLVRSSLNDITAATQIAAEMDVASSSLPEKQILNFSFDPDAPGKRRFASLLGGSDIPTYRYVVTSAQITPDTMLAVEKELPHFAPADGSFTR